MKLCQKLSNGDIMTINTNAYGRKEIEVHIEVNRPLIASKSAENRTIKLHSIAIEANVSIFGLPDKTRANIKLYGLSLSLMEELSALNIEQNYIANHRVTLYAGDSLDNMQIVFIGELTKAFANFNEIPDVCFEIEAMTGYYPSLLASIPLSYKGEIEASIILAALASSIGYSFENKAFSSSIRNPILSGSVFEKALKIAKHTNAELLCEKCKFTLMPKSTAISNNYTTISDKNGLVAYPMFDNEGLSFTALFNANFQLNGLVEIESIVPKASGFWRIISLQHILSSNNEKNLSWFSKIKCVAYN